MSEDTINVAEARGEGAGAVSIYGEARGADDFPVLKAFQQYIDAEQAKAQKRMTVLCIFFAVILLVVVSVFTWMLVRAGSRNEILTENISTMTNEKQLAEEKAAAAKQQAEEQVSAAKREAEMKLDYESKLADMRVKAAEEKVAALKAELASAGGGTPVAAPKIEAGLSDAKLRENALKLKKVRESLAAEKERLAKEKERLRQKEIELQQRKLYPELFQEKADIVEEDAPPMRPSQSIAPAKAAKAARRSNAEDEDDAPISYFDAEDDKPMPTGGYRIPVEVKGRKSSWSFGE